MKIAKRPRRSLAVSRGLRRRQARATADEVDRRLFLQLSTSAVIVAIAVLVSVAGGGIQEGMINTIEKNTGLEEVNAALTSMMESVPVIGNLFSGEGAVQVFSSGNELSDDSPTSPLSRWSPWLPQTISPLTTRSKAALTKVPLSRFLTCPMQQTAA